MRVLVVGGSGFLGQHLCSYLVENGYEVINVDLKDSIIQHSRLMSVRADANELVTTFGAEVVINCAAMVPLTRSRKGFRASNLSACKNLLDVSRREKVRHFIFVSSSAVYGIPKLNPVENSHPKIPFESYGKSKLAAEKLCLSYRGGDMLISIARPRTIAGNGRKGIFSILFELILDGKKIPLFKNGSNRFQFVHVSDVVAPIELICRSRKEIEINLGSIDYPSLRDSLESLIKHASSASRFIRFPLFTLNMVFLLSKIRLLPFAHYQLKMYDKEFFFLTKKEKNALGWQPQYTSTQALIASFETYSASKSEVNDGSAHQRAASSKLLKLAMRLL